MTWLRTLRHRGGADSGFTLAELAVSMTVFSLLMVFTTSMTIQSHRLFRENMLREDSAQTASLVMSELTKTIRSAVPNGPAGSQVAFVAATATSITFTSALSATATGQTRKRIYLNGGGVLQVETTLPDTASTDPNYTYATNRGLVTSPIAGRLVDTGTLFAYLLNDATTVTSPTTGQLATISGVQITLSVNQDTTNKIDPTVLYSLVQPYNL